ncbi:MAG: hypothetical protein ACSHX7_13175 [Luteolibacter sp.]
MQTLKTIALGAVVLGAIGCEPLPPYPPSYYDSYGRPVRQPYGNQGQQGQPNPQGTQYQQATQGDNRYGQATQDSPQVDPTPPPVETAPQRNEYPTAQGTSNPNQVLSPYAPYNVIDVEGFRTGQLAKDPSNGKIFRVP